MSESGTKPSDEMAWASSAAAGDVTAPSGGQEAAGYTFNQVLPHDEFNYILKNFTDWISYLHDGRPRSFTSLSSLCSSLSAGEVGFVKDLDADSEYLSQSWQTSMYGDDNDEFNKTIATDGERIYFATRSTTDYNGSSVSGGATGMLVAISATDGSLLWTRGNLSGDASVSETSVSADGNAVFLTQNAKVFKLKPSDGTDFGGGWPSAGVSHGGNIYSVFSDGKYVFIGGDQGTDNDTHRKMRYSDGSIVAAGTASKNHGDSVYQIISDGRFVYIAGENGESADYDDGAGNEVSAAFRKLKYDDLSNVTDFDNSKLYFSYPPHDTETGVTFTCMAISEHSIFLAGSNNLDVGSAMNIRCIQQDTADVVWSVGADESGIIKEAWGIVFDGRGHVIISGRGGTSSGVLLARLNARTGHGVDRVNFDFSSITGTTDHTDYKLTICTDGFNLYSFLHYNSAVSDKSKITSHKLNAPPTMVTKMAGTERYRKPYHIAAMPHFYDET